MSLSRTPAVFLCVVAARAALAGPPTVSPALIPKAPPLPPPTGNVVRIDRFEKLYDAVRRGSPGVTYLVADGTYYLPDLLRIQRDGVTIRGESGDRDKVVLDGSRCKSKELIWFEGADDVTVADLTVRNARVHAFTVKGEHDTQRPRIYNCRIRNAWERYVKGTAPRKDQDAHKVRPSGGRIEYCLFTQDHKKDHTDWTGGDYIGGIDMMWLKGWVIADNVFVGIQGLNNRCRPAIFIWNNSEDVVVERNVIIGCDTGIGFGNPSGGALHVTRGIMRNNFVVRGSYKAIEVVRTKGCKVYSNTVYCEDMRFRRAFHAFQLTEGLEMMNNLVRGPSILVGDGGAILKNNVSGGLGGCFVDPARGDLHLTAAATLAINKGTPIADVKDDIDGQARDAQPDVGADELGRRTREAERVASKGKEGESVWTLVAEMGRARGGEEGGRLEEAKALARAGEFEGAAEVYAELAKADEGLSGLAEALLKARELRQWIIEGVAAGRKAKTYVEVAGARVRGKVVSADARGLTVAWMENEVPLPWDGMTPARLVALARRYAKGTPGREELLEAFARACGLGGG